ncbi:MAG TPA: glycosyltransferase family 9 protein [Acidimicrobiales bacterium]|nr:glycosyltransferase family 9 protein [Acidimicrobiales bacterium]
MRIAALRALPGVGDLLCAVPALWAVRVAHPRARMTLLGLTGAAWFVERFPHLLDDLLVVEGVSGIPEVTPDRWAFVRFTQAARAQRFDLALQLHGSGVTSNAVAASVGADRVVAPGEALPYRDDIPEIHRLLAVAEAAGCPPAGDELELPVTAAERARAARVAGEGRPLACLHPGASRACNRWPADRFAALGDHLAGRGMAVVLTGTAGESRVTAAVAGAMQAPALDLAGRTDIGTLAALFERARVVVSNDTGAAHVAAAVEAASVVVYPATGDPDRWAPLDSRLHRRVTPPPGEAWPVTGGVVAAVDAHLDEVAV